MSVLFCCDRNMKRTSQQSTTRSEKNVAVTDIHNVQIDGFELSAGHVNRSTDEYSGAESANNSRSSDQSSSKMSKFECIYKY